MSNSTTKYGVIISKKTLDATHQDMLIAFKKRREDLPKLKKKLELLDESQLKLRENINQTDDPIKQMEINQEIWELDDVRDNINKRICEIETNKDEMEYLLSTGQIMKAYYNENQEIDHNNKQKKKQNNKKNKSVLDWLGAIEENVDDTNNTLKIINVNDDTSNEKNTNDITITENIAKYKTTKGKKSPTENKLCKNSKNSKNRYKGMSKQRLYDEYMNSIDTDYILENESDSDDDDNSICQRCDGSMLLDQNIALLVCKQCGYQEQVLIDSNKPSYKDPPKEVTSFCYKRINHLNECLAQFQAKETTDIPDEVYEEILNEMKKARIEISGITDKKLRDILKKLNRSNYYEHIPYIINQLNGRPPPVISPEVEEIIRGLFKEIQEPFERNRDKMYSMKKRKNFISYSYVVYKLFELLELDEYLYRFQLLKSDSKMYNQDIIWKKICHDVGWQFIPST